MIKEPILWETKQITNSLNMSLQKNQCHIKAIFKP